MLDLRNGLVALMGLVTAACCWAGNALTFAVARIPLSLPVYVAEAEKYFEAEGVPITIQDCAFGRLCLRELIEGRAQISTVADSPIVFASFTNNSFAIIATIASTRNDTKIITHRDGGIRTSADLAGKKVGTFVGTSAHYFLDSLALLSGVDPATIKLVNLKPDDVNAQLGTRAVDAVAVFEPYGYAAARSLGPQAQVLVNKHVYMQTWNVVAARAILDARARDLQALLRALDRAEQFIQKEPAKAQAILRARLKLDETAIAWLWKDLSFALTLEQSLLTTLEGEARWAVRSNLAKGPAPNYLTLIHAGPILQVRPQAVSLVR